MSLQVMTSAVKCQSDFKVHQSMQLLLAMDTPPAPIINQEVNHHHTIVSNVLDEEESSNDDLLMNHFKVDMVPKVDMVDVPVEPVEAHNGTTLDTDNTVIHTLAQFLDCNGTNDQLQSILYAIQPSNDVLDRAYEQLRQMAINNCIDVEDGRNSSIQAIVNLWQSVTMVAPTLLAKIPFRSDNPITQMHHELANVKKLLLTVCATMQSLIEATANSKLCCQHTNSAQISPLSTTTSSSTNQHSAGGGPTNQQQALSGSRRRKAHSSAVTHISLENVVEKMKRVKRDSMSPEKCVTVMPSSPTPTLNKTATSTSTVIPPITMPLPASAPTSKTPKRSPHYRAKNKKNKVTNWQPFAEMNNNVTGVQNQNSSEVASSTLFPANQPTGGSSNVFNPLAAFGVTNTDDPNFGQWLQLYYAMNLKNRLMQMHNAANGANGATAAPLFPPQLEHNSPSAHDTTSHTSPPMNLSMATSIERIGGSDSPDTPTLEMATEYDDMSRSASSNQLAVDGETVPFRAPYQCREPNCTKSFANKFLLKKHEFIHTGQRPHQCPYCSKKFNRKDNLLRHKKTHMANSVNGIIGAVGGNRRRNLGLAGILPTMDMKFNAGVGVGDALIANHAAPPTFDVSQFVQQAFGNRQLAQPPAQQPEVGELPMQLLANIVNGFQMPPKIEENGEQT